MKTNVISTLACLLGVVGPLGGATLFVSPSGSDVAPHASEATAARSVQSAIDLAASGDVIRLAPGRYAGTIDFRGKALSVVGAGPESILDGEGVGPVVTFGSGESRLAVLDSVQVTGGRAEDGAGILIENASPTIQRSVIFRNRAGGAGAGILVNGRQASPLIRNNVIAYNDDSTPQLTDAHQIFIDSGASAQIVNNTIVRGNGNAILVQGSNRPTFIANNILAWNGSRLGNGALIGRGICDFSGSARIRYNLFFQNTRSAFLTDVPGGGFEDFALVSDAQSVLRGSRVAENFDAIPRLFRTPPLRTPLEIRVENFRPRGGATTSAGDPGAAFRNGTGGRNTVGHTGGPLGWR